MGLQADILSCKTCKIDMTFYSSKTVFLQAVKTIAGPVVGSGNPNANIMIVGQNSCYPKCLESGVVFTGGSGILLNKALKMAGLTREDVWITNVVKCATIGNEQPTPKMKETCKKFLQRELNIIKPELVITLGKYAQRGFPKGNYELVSLLHPAHYLRTGKGELFISDFIGVIKKWI